MKTTHNNTKIISANNVTWIDIKNPKQTDLDQLKEEIKLHPMIRRQFLPPIHRPKIEEHPKQIFIVLHFPVYNEDKRKNNAVELDIIITPTTLITSHAGTIPSLDIFFNDCQHQAYHQKHYFKSTNHLALRLLDWLIDECLPMLDHVSEEITDIEKNVFEGHEKEMVTEIAVVKRNLINFRRAIKPQHSILELLEKKYRRLYGREFKLLTQEVVGSCARVWNVLENHQELINSLEQTNNSLLSHKLNDIMKFLTVISFITFPLSVIVGFFGMNIFHNIPIVGHPLTWVVITAVMIVSTTIMVFYFKNKRWL